MNIPYTYSCPITKYNVEYIVNDISHAALLNGIVCDYKNIKALMLLLRSSIDKLQKQNIIMITQFVAFEEWELYLENKTTWKIVNVDKTNNVYTISCPIDDFLMNYGVGIGVI